jgi:hypothetical protein
MHYCISQHELSVTSMGTTSTNDEKTTLASAAEASQSNQPLTEERRTIIAEYASRLREIVKRLRKRLH